MTEHIDPERREALRGVALTSDEVSAVISGLRWASLHPTDGAPATWGSRWRSIADRLEASI